MAEQYQRPYADANVFIAWIKGEVVKGIERARVADHILYLAETGSFKIYTSTLTLAEVHKLRTGPVLDPSEGDKILSYFEHDFFQFIDVDRNIGEQANRLCRQHGIYPNDAIHLASALRARCDVLLAWDERFAKVNHPDIRIEEPQIIGQGRLPNMAP